MARDRPVPRMAIAVRSLPARHVILLLQIGTRYLGRVGGNVKVSVGRLGIERGILSEPKAGEANVKPPLPPPLVPKVIVQGP